MTLIILNEIRICFIFLVPSRFAAVSEMISSAKENLRKNFRRLFGLCFMRP